MACIEVTVGRVGVSPIVDISAASVIEPKVVRVGESLAVACSIVCNLADLYYLEVSPKDVQWITPDFGIVYRVESNTKWIVMND